MGIFSRFEGRMEDTLEGAANKMFDSPISPVQIAKKAEKQMRREKMVGAGKQYAPTLYTVLVNEEDDQRLFGYYPTLAGETETYLAAKAVEQGLVMDGQPLVRFIADEGLRHGKFEVIAEMVANPIIARLRAEEMDRYGIGDGSSRRHAAGAAVSAGRAQGFAAPSPAPAPAAAPIPQVAPGAPDPFAPSPYFDPNPAFDPAPQPQAQAFDQQPQPAVDPYGAYPQAAAEKQPLPYVPEEDIDYSVDYGEYTFNSQDFEDYRQSGGQENPAGYPPMDAAAGYAQAEPQMGYPQADVPAGYPQEEAFYGAEEPAYEQPSYPAATPAAAASPYQAPDLGASPAFPGAAAAAGVVAGAAMGAAGVGAGTVNPVPAQPVAAPAPAYEDANTVVFAAGGGNAQPLPNNTMVRASLLNATDNRSYDLATSRLLLGRENTNDIVVDDINASRVHAELRYEPQGVWVVTDLGSTNGTLVNGRETTSQALADGDYITIGMTNFVFVQS